MNCQTLISDLGFDCQDIGGDTLRVWSPFTHANDGEIIGLYVEKLRDGYRVTDNAEAFMHASMMGIKLSDRRFDAVRRASGDVEISNGGVISTFVDEQGLKEGFASVLNASMAVSHFETLWIPRIKSESFSKAVGDILEMELGNKLKRDVGVTGASGHQLSLPLAIIQTNAITYVQPIAASAEETIEWTNVYSGFGKMMDLKNAGASRIVVLEDAANDSEFPKAQTLLGMSATVVKYSNLREWARKHAA